MESERQYSERQNTDRDVSPSPEPTGPSGAVSGRVAYQKFNETQIGPSQLKKKLKEYLGSITVPQWKNIPMPVCSATETLMLCINDLKRFVIFLENRFCNLTSSNAQHTIEIFDLTDKFKKEAQESLDQTEQRLLNKIAEMQALITNQTDLKLTELQSKSEMYTQEKITLEINMFKTWAGRVIDDKIMANERKVTIDFTKKLKEVKDMFNVPELIGDQCQFPNYQQFQIKQRQAVEEIEKVLSNHDSQFTSQNQSNQNFVSQIQQMQIDLVQQSDDLKTLLEDRQTSLTQLVKSLDLNQTKNQLSLKAQLDQQDIGQLTREQVKSICQQWNTKMESIDQLNQQIIQQLQSIDVLREDLQLLQTDLNDKTSQNEQNCYDLNSKINQQEQQIQDLILKANSPKVMTSFNKQKLSSKFQVQPKSQLQSEQVSEKPDGRESSVQIKQTNSHSEINTITVEEQSKPKHMKSTDVEQIVEPYKNKTKTGKRSTSSRKSSLQEKGASECSPGLSSRSSNNKKNNAVEKNKESQEKSTKKQKVHHKRVQSAKQPQTKVQKEDSEENEVLVDPQAEDLIYRIIDLEQEIRVMKRGQAKILQNQEKMRVKKTIRNGVDMSLAGVLELGKTYNKKEPKLSNNNSPENRQLNAQSYNTNSRGPLMWEAEKKKWVNVPKQSTGLLQESELLLQNIQKSRERHLKQPPIIIQDNLTQESYNMQSGMVKRNVPTVNSNESIFQLQAKSANILPKYAGPGVILNSSSHQQMISESGSVTDYKNQVTSLKDYDMMNEQITRTLLNQNLVGMSYESNLDRKQPDLLQHHAQIYYKLDPVGTQKKRPQTGVKPQQILTQQYNSQSKQDLLPVLQQSQNKQLNKPQTSNLLKKTN